MDAHDTITSTSATDSDVNGTEENTEMVDTSESITIHVKRDDTPMATGSKSQESEPRLVSISNECASTSLGGLSNLNPMATTHVDHQDNPITADNDIDHDDADADHSPTTKIAASAVNGDGDVNVYIEGDLDNEEDENSNNHNDDSMGPTGNSTVIYDNHTNDAAVLPTANTVSIDDDDDADHGYINADTNPSLPASELESNYGYSLFVSSDISAQTMTATASAITRTYEPMNERLGVSSSMNIAKKENRSQSKDPIHVESLSSPSLDSSVPTPISSVSTQRLPSSGAGQRRSLALRPIPVSPRSTATIVSRISQRWRENAATLSKECQNDFRSAIERLGDSLQKHFQSSNSHTKGLSLPASAVGWLSYLHNQETNDDSIGNRDDEPFLPSGLASCLFPPDRSHTDSVGTTRVSNDQSMGGLTQWEDIRPKLSRITHIRITREMWPVQSGSRRKQERRWDVIREMILREQQHRQETNATESDSQEVCRHIEFLTFYHTLIHSPRLDMGIFPRCQVLLLEQVPADWIKNLGMVQDTLKLLRVDRSGIYKLGRFLLPYTPSTQGSRLRVKNSIASISDGSGMYRHLTHLRLSHCGLTDSSLFYVMPCEDVSARGSRATPVLGQLHSIQTLCLSHNEISSDRGLAGLAKMPRLASLDLSFNRIQSLRRIHYRVGNIHTLILSHNRLTTAGGIDRLVALRKLWIDHNEIRDLSQITSLARLPELESIRMIGNPIQLSNPFEFRVDFLDLFRECRRLLLTRTATYADLRRILPELDGERASIREMRALKRRIVPSSIPPNRTEETSHYIDVSMESGICERHYGATIIPLSAKHVRRRRRQATFDQPMQYCTIPPRRGSHDSRYVSHNNARPTLGFTFNSVLESMRSSRSVPPNEVLGTVKNSDNTANSRLRQATSLPKPQSISMDAVPDETTLIDLRIIETDACKNMADTYLAAALSFKTDSGRNVRRTLQSKLPDGNDNGAESNKTFNDDHDVSFAVNQYTSGDKPANTDGTDSVCSPRKKAVESVSVSNIDAHDNSLKHLTDEEIARKLHDELNPMFPLDSKVCPHESNDVLSTPTNRDIFNDADKTATVSANSEKSVASTDRSIDSEALAPRIGQDLVNPATSPNATSPVGDVIFHDSDQNSVQSSIGTPSRSDPRKYQLAEEKSIYEGPNAYRRLKVYSDLELYFRLFVFPNAQVDDDLQSKSSLVDVADDHNDWRCILQRNPRIQLWPVDRKDQESGPIRNESFYRLWKEMVVACGKPALRRMTPCSSGRFGFHGELLWSDVNNSGIKPETVVESREIIACLSSACLYLIVDNDKVSNKFNGAKRRFPRPIPSTALFHEAYWPHALARHPISTLRSITIGFGFQRLVLRFGKSKDASPEDFIYVLITSNKGRSISLLKEVQDLAQENQTSSIDLFSDPTKDALLIENDDRHVLDALGVAVAPDIVGVVLHYQILGQKWRSGARGVARRVCVVTDTKLFLLDEDYIGDGSGSIDVPTRELGKTMYRLVDSAPLSHVGKVQAADADPNSITIVIRPPNSFQRARNWRLVCRDRLGAEQLVDDVRRALILL